MPASRWPQAALPTLLGFLGSQDSTTQVARSIHQCYVCHVAQPSTKAEDSHQRKKKAKTKPMPSSWNSQPKATSIRPIMSTNQMTPSPSQPGHQNTGPEITLSESVASLSKLGPTLAIKQAQHTHILAVSHTVSIWDKAEEMDTNDCMWHWEPSSGTPMHNLDQP